MAEDFKWTDELVVEFTTWSLRESPAMQGRYSDLEQFKQMKKSKPLFVTNDKVEIFPNCIYFKVVDYTRINEYVATEGGRYPEKYTESTYSTRAEAERRVQSFIAQERVFSLADIHELLYAQHTDDLDKIYQAAKEAAERRVK